MAKKTKQPKPTKAYAFIDATNFENSIKEAGFNTVDYQKLFTWLTSRMNCSKVFFYAGEQVGDAITKQKHKTLQGLGYKIRIKKAQVYKNKDILWQIRCICGRNWIETINTGFRTKANCDVTLTFDSMRNLADYNKAIFFTGDGDFYDLFDYLVRRKRKVVIISLGFNHVSKRTSLLTKRTSLLLKPLLKNRAVNFIDLSVQFPKGILIT